MKRGDRLVESADELFEHAPCGYLAVTSDGVVTRVNETFLALTGYGQEELVERRRLQELLAPGARIFWETHLAPLLMMQGQVNEIAVEVLRADGSRLPAFMSCVLRPAPDGTPQGIFVVLFPAADRRRYEDELLAARRRERETARTLQRGMLVSELPQPEGFDLHVTYRPAVSGLEVGGDWYDAFWLEPGETLGLVVGDVVGRGVDAAATMGQLRSAVRAFAWTGLGPSGLLEAMDGYVRRHGAGTMTTLVYAQLDVRRSTLRYAAAGHPPPVLARPGEAPTLLWGGRSLPLDAHPDPGRPRDEAHAELPPGSVVLLYTDGLVERRSVSLDVGLDRLVDGLTRHRGAPPSQLAGDLVRGLHDPEHSDDICLLVASARANAS